MDVATTRTELVLPAGTWAVDPARSTVGFVARHFVVTKVRGRFTRFAGTITTGTAALGATVDAFAEAASLDTGDTTRDDHLRSADVFDVTRWPTLALRGTVTGRTRLGYLLEAQLTIRDVTRPVRFDVTAGRIGRGGDGRYRLSVLASATVNRKDFGLQWSATLETGGVVVADHVHLRLDVEAVRTGPP